jgi:hypothetical protein
MRKIKNLMCIALLFSVCRLFGEDTNMTSKPEESPICTFNGHVYKLCNELASWDMAKNKCAAMGGTLVIIKSQEENSFVFSKIKDISGIIYIGASDVEREGLWKWPDGSAVTYNKWPGGQPEVYHGTAHYAAFNPVKSGDYWIHPDKNDPTYGFICYWESEDLYKNSLLPKKQFKATSTPVVDADPTPGTTSKFVDLRMKDFMYDKDALVKLEDQLDYIEMAFWKATVLSKTDDFSRSMERKLFTLVCTARLIQQTLVRENKTEGINVPNGATKLSEVWQKFSGKNIYQRGTIKCMSRRSFKLYDKEDPYPYLDWLRTTSTYNIGLFAYKDDKTLQAKVSNYFMAVEVLRRDIVAISKLGLFIENENLVPAKFSVKNSSTNKYFVPCKSTGIKLQ